jgi:hypothetical protein
MYTNKLLFTSHSKIYSYPPNPIEFPNFYNCKEQIYILNPGDMLYIPPQWFHWVFSYPEIDSKNRENIAISYNIYDLFNKNVYNEFALGKPLKFTLDKENHSFLNLELNNIISCNLNHKFSTFVTTTNTIVPVKKNLNHIYKNDLTFQNILNLHEKEKFNINIGSNQIIPKMLDIKIPHIIETSFLNNEIIPLLWINLLNNKNSYIETGLHYDITHNVLIQIKGTKVVRLFNPKYSKNLYLQPMYKY